jgi:hypothetical protein
MAPDLRGQVQEFMEIGSHAVFTECILDGVVVLLQANVKHLQIIVAECICDKMKHW